MPTLDFGRTDTDNEGLARFKRSWGAEEESWPTRTSPTRRRAAASGLAARARGRADPARSRAHRTGDRHGALPPRRMTDPEHLLYERYVGSAVRSRKLELYYALKPMMPRACSSPCAGPTRPRQARREFPRWPFEPTLVEHRDGELRRATAASGADRLPFVNFWPERKRFCVVLTHDVEGPEGVENIMRVIELERRYGFVSSWNFVAEWYPIPDGLFDEIRARRLRDRAPRHPARRQAVLQSRETSRRTCRRSRDVRASVGRGRLPLAGHRIATPSGWRELPVDYDSSFPDSDPFEPQAGGCCSIMPFFFGDVVELPITLMQDHTMFEILREPGIDRWPEKSDWIMRAPRADHVIVHPDYVVEQRFLTATRPTWPCSPSARTAGTRCRATSRAGGASATGSASTSTANSRRHDRLRRHGRLRDRARWPPGHGALGRRPGRFKLPAAASRCRSRGAGSPRGRAP